MCVCACEKLCWILCLCCEYNRKQKKISPFPLYPDVRVGVCVKRERMTVEVSLPLSHSQCAHGDWKNEVNNR